MRYKGFFAQVFYNANNSGNTSSTDTTGTFYLRTGLPVVDKSTVTVGQVQQAFRLGNSSMVAGADYIYTHPVSDSTIFGRNEGSTDIHEEGIYLQATVPIADKIDFIRRSARRPDGPPRRHAVLAASSRSSTRRTRTTTSASRSAARSTRRRASSICSTSSRIRIRRRALRCARSATRRSRGGSSPAAATRREQRPLHALAVRGGRTDGGDRVDHVGQRFSGFMSQFAQISAALPASTFASPADPTGVASKAGFIAG